MNVIVLLQGKLDDMITQITRHNIGTTWNRQTQTAASGVIFSFVGGFNQ